MRDQAAKYTGIPSSAPAFPMIEEKVKAMGRTDWQIFAGKYSNRDGVMLDRTVLEGGDDFNALLKRLAK